MVHSGIALFSPMLYHGTMGLSRLGDMLLGGGLNIHVAVIVLLW